MTNRKVDNDSDAVALINWYRARWEIEILFDVLKNACRVEALQLGSIDKLEHALALFMVVAWRIAYLMRSGRTCPDLNAALFFDPDEIHSAYLSNDRDAPNKPRLNDVLRLVARLGGFLGRKSDREPGVKTFWLGMKEIYVAAQTMANYGIESTPKLVYNEVPLTVRAKKVRIASTHAIRKRVSY